MNRRLLTALLGVLLALSARPALAASCASGNLLTGILPHSSQPLPTTQAQALVDAVVTQAGGRWNVAQAVPLSANQQLTWDIGRPQPLGSLYLQADNNDSYVISASLDGTHFEPLWVAGPVSGMGLRARTAHFPQRQARYLRIHAEGGDGYYSISELQWYCADHAAPQLHVTQVASAVAVPPVGWQWDDQTSAHWEGILAVLALVLLLWRYRPERRRIRDAALIVLGLIAFASYFNFGAFHFPRFLHYWDSFHYYVGGKYFPELGYTRLYDCVAVADAESGLRDKVRVRHITNLSNNSMETGAQVLAHPEICKSHFTIGRWREFKHDVAFFRQHESRWEDLSTDHGFNATPVWLIAGHLLTDFTGPVSKAKLTVLAAIDPLYLVAALALIAWAFGWRVSVVAIAVLATWFPARYYWTGGSILRWDWLFYSTACVCLLRKRYYALAGAALAYAVGLRIFPVFMLVGALLGMGWQCWRQRILPREWRRFIVGGVVASAVLIPASLWASGRVDVYQAFLHNTFKHEATPMTNNMGLRTVLSYAPADVGRYLRDGSLLDPWSRWKAARIQHFEQRKGLYVALLAAYLALLAWALRNQPPWVALALGSTFISFGVELTSYYYAFVMVVALLAAARPRAGPILLAAAAAGHFMAAAPLAGMSSWFDEVYTWISLITIVAFVLICIEVGRRQPSMDNMHP